MCEPDRATPVLSNQVSFSPFPSGRAGGVGPERKTSVWGQSIGLEPPKPTMLARVCFALAALFAFSTPTFAAPPTPRDEALRLAPSDFALVAVVQSLRDHATAIAESPFAAWFPTSELGKRFLNSADFTKLTDATAPLFGTLGITPTDLFHDIIGDAVVFAYAPAPDNDPKGERSIILVRPRKLATLVSVIERLNEAANQIEGTEGSSNTSTRARSTSSGRSPKARPTSTASSALCSRSRNRKLKSRRLSTAMRVLRKTSRPCSSRE